MNVLWFTIFMLALNIVIGSEDANLGNSCNDKYQHNPFSRGRTGNYWMATNEGVFEVPCNMKLKCSGVERGWMQVINRDMNWDDNWPAQ